MPQWFLARLLPNKYKEPPNNNAIFAKIMNGETFNSEDIVDEPNCNCIMCSQDSNETIHDVIPTVITNGCAPEHFINC